MATKKKSVRKAKKPKPAAKKKSATRRRAKRTVVARKTNKPAAKRAAPKRKAKARPASNASAEQAKADLAAIYSELKSMLGEYSTALRVQAEKAGTYYLNTWRDDAHGKPVWFGGARRRKDMVSLYLAPLKEFADLLGTIPADLQKRMSGKAQFDFRSLAELPREELRRLIATAVERVRAVGGQTTNRTSA
jgi:hypothetical protein